MTVHSLGGLYRPRPDLAGRLLLLRQEQARLLKSIWIELLKANPDQVDLSCVQLDGSHAPTKRLSQSILELVRVIRQMVNWPSGG